MEKVSYGSHARLRLNSPAGIARKIIGHRQTRNPCNNVKDIPFKICHKLNFAKYIKNEYNQRNHPQRQSRFQNFQPSFTLVPGSITSFEILDLFPRQSLPETEMEQDILCSVSDFDRFCVIFILFVHDITWSKEFHECCDLYSEMQCILRMGWERRLSTGMQYAWVKVTLRLLNLCWSAKTEKGEVVGFKTIIQRTAIC